jgi:hypothetical protein
VPIVQEAEKGPRVGMNGFVKSRPHRDSITGPSGRLSIGLYEIISEEISLNCLHMHGYRCKGTGKGKGNGVPLQAWTGP